MRREGVIFLSVLISLQVLLINLETILNKFAMFILAGIIPGTSVVFSSSVMMLLSLSSLSVFIAWPFRNKIFHYISEQPIYKSTNSYISYLKRRRFRQTIV